MRARGTDAAPLGPKPSVEQYRKQAKELLKAATAGPPNTIREWASRLYPRGVNDVVASAEKGLLPRASKRPLKLADAQWFLAWLHGFESWAKLVHYIEGIERPDSPVALFERAVDAVIDGDLPALERLLATHPSLVRARSTRDHHATLLHYVAANGHETFRQRTPKNAVDVARLLLRSGAEPDALADMYETTCTTMEMLVSSAHPYEAGVQVALAELLLDFGAAVNGVNDDGSPLMTALAFYYYPSAVALVRRGARIDNVMSAAAMGRTDLVDQMVLPGGKLRPDVRLARGPWPKASDDPAVHIGNALHFAAAFGHMDVVRLLVERGASLETHNAYGNTVLSATLWFARNAPMPGLDYPRIVRELIAMGARTD